MIDTLSYSTDAKFSWLQSSGYYRFAISKHKINIYYTFFRDTFKLPIKGASRNSGFSYRQKLFMEGGKYHGNKVTFIGKLHSDLSSSRVGTSLY